MLDRYNGEIYHYDRLRGILEDLGHTFWSQNDTEVLLRAFTTWGEAALQRLNGMFAFAIWDSANQRLFAARDRFGIKPLHYSLTPDALYLCSEIKQLTRIPGWRARANPQQAFDFLEFCRADHYDETFFADVHQVPPGHTLNAWRDASGRVRIRVAPWYELPSTRLGDVTPAQAAESCRSLLRDAVRARLRADVPLGSCLSGGLDSSGIVCLMAEALAESGSKRLVETVTAYEPDPAVDDRAYVRAVTDATGAKSCFVRPDPRGCLENLKSLTWTQDEPFGSTSIYAQWLVYQAARRAGITVMLDGQGADELFAGYHRAFPVRLAELTRTMRILEAVCEASAVSSLHGYSRRYLAGRVARQLPLAVRLQRTRRRWGLQPMPLLSTRWLRRAGVDLRGPFVGRGEEQSSLRAARVHDLSRGSLPALLRYEDRNSMAASVESRVPYLDHRLVEFLVSLPTDLTMRRGWTKLILRQALTGVIPTAIVERIDKIGFATAETSWFTEQSHTAFEQLLAQAGDSLGILDSSAVLQASASIGAGRGYSSMMWRAVSLSAWTQRFNVDWGAP